MSFCISNFVCLITHIGFVLKYMHWMIFTIARISYWVVFYIRIWDNLPFESNNTLESTKLKPVLYIYKIVKAISLFLNCHRKTFSMSHQFYGVNKTPDHSSSIDKIPEVWLWLRLIKRSWFDLKKYLHFLNLIIL